MKKILCTTFAISLLISTMFIQPNSKVEDQIHNCVKNNLKLFQDLNCLNIQDHMTKIQQLKECILQTLKNASPEDQKKHKALKDALENLDINKGFEAVQKFKHLLPLLPKNTLNLIKNNINDPIVRRSLGL